MRFSPNFTTKSRTFRWFWQISNFDQNRDFWQISNEIEIFENFDIIKIFLKIFRPKSRFSTFWQISINRDFRQFPKVSKIWPKSWFFPNFDQNGNVSKISNKMGIFSKYRINSWFLKHFDQNRDFRKYRDFSKISSKTKICYKFRPKSRFSRKFDQNRDFREISTKIEIFAHFDLNWDFQKISTKIEIFN